MIRDPQLNKDKDNLHRVSGYMSPEDFALLKAVSPERGIVQLLINLMMADIVEEMRNENLTIWSPENSEKLEEIVRKRTTNLALK